MKRIMGIILAVLVLCSAAQATELRVVGWNMESGDASPYLLAQQMRQIHGVDIWGLSEVKGEEWAKVFAKAAQNARTAHFKALLGSTGRDDRLLILYNSDRFEEISSYELEDINIGGTLRAPLAVELRDKQTNISFVFMVNHLCRGKTKPEPRRTKQAQMLKDYALKVGGPVIAVGDYNFDCEVKDLGKCDQAFYKMVDGDVFDWVQPSNPMRTQCNPHFDSILDFLFVGNQARAWRPESQILHTSKEMCRDDKYKSDHRPVLGVLDVPNRN